jgi:hypothetical protein
VDDALGTQSKEAAVVVSQGMEDIISNRGFYFKEAVMTGDPLVMTGEL